SDTRPSAVALTDGQLVPEAVRLDNASLASQAVGPVLNQVEMSYEGRTWSKLGKKFLNFRPLARQRVAPDDSVLGAMANPNGNRLLSQHTYTTLIQAAFQAAY